VQITIFFTDRGSFVPPIDIQDLRDLTRYRAELKQAQSKVANRIQKLLELANIKLSSVPSNALGVSGRKMVEAGPSCVTALIVFVNCCGR